MFRENYITTIWGEHIDKTVEDYCCCQDEIQTSELNISWTKRTIFLEFLYFLTSFQSSKFSKQRRLLPNKKLNLSMAYLTGVEPEFGGHACPRIGLSVSTELWVEVGRWYRCSRYYRYKMVKFNIWIARLEHLIFLRA